MTRNFPGRFDSLAAIGQFVRSQAQQSGLDEKAVYQVEMAVDEACSNIIEHAYGSDETGEIAVTCQESPEGLTVILRDTGVPFDPQTVQPPDLAAGLEERSSHGLGMFFIREWMDKVQYKTVPGEGNVLTLFKRRSGSAKPGGRAKAKP